MAKEKNFISIVAYVHNDEDKINEFLDKIYKEIDNNFEKFEMIFVNDTSTDKSVDKIREFSKNNNLKNQINVVNMSYYQGIETSMNAGKDFAIGDFVYEFDNIFIDYDITVIMDIYYHSLKGFDIVSAASTRKGRKSSKLFYKLFNSNSNSQYNLHTETFRIISRRGINRVDSLTEMISYRKAIYSNCGLKYDSLYYDPIKEFTPKKTSQKENIRQELAIDSLILFTNIAYKFSITLTICFLAISILGGIYVVFTYMFSRPIAGWTTTMMYMSFGFFSIFLLFAIVIKYLSVIVNIIFRKQRYIIESIEKITK